MLSQKMKEKAFDKVQYLFLRFNKLEIEGNFLNLINNDY